MKRHLIITALALLVTAAATHIITRQTLTSSATSSRPTEPEVLYWVAPMDPNYRRDQPGKSPMGMDLIPVYADSLEVTKSNGEISIDPNVVNNLGVRTARVSLHAVGEAINTVGYIRFDEDRLVHVHPRVEGWIEQLYVKSAGDPVRRGEALYALYSPELVNAQEELLLALKRSNAALVAAAEDRLRAMEVAPEAINQLKTSGELQRAVLFYAPQDGVIDKLNIREGFFVQPGTTLMSVGALDDVWVEAEIFERQAAQVGLGQSVTMTLDYLPGRQWQGSVDYIYPTLDAVTRTARLRIRVANPDGLLKPNMFADLWITAGEDPPVLAIPVESLIRTAHENRVVLALGDGRFKSIVVSTGRSNGQFVEVLTGLEEGDRIVTSAQFLLDSESSKTSDFRRIDHGGIDHGTMNHDGTDHDGTDHGGTDHGGTTPREESATGDHDD